MSEMKDGGPAFPGLYDDGDPENLCFSTTSGLSIRDWFAGQIAAGMAAFSGTAGVSYGPDEIAGRSYQVADAMLKAREA